MASKRWSCGLEEPDALGRHVDNTGKILDPLSMIPIWHSANAQAIQKQTYGSVLRHLLRAWTSEWRSALVPRSLGCDPFDAKDALGRIFVANCYGLLIGGRII
jgi:hypothetical protein